VRERGVVTLENAIDIARRPEDVFDYLTDMTNELEWSPRTRRVEKLIQGPVGLGTRYEAEWIKGSPMMVEYVRFARPASWASTGRSSRMDAESEGRVSPTERGTYLVIRTELRPKGVLALVLPLIRRTMHTREKRNLGAIKAALESS